MKILFLDQSGKIGGAELALLDIVQACGDRSLVCLFQDGDYRERLEQHHIPVKVLSEANLSVHKESGLFQGLASLGKLLPLIQQVAELSHHYDAIYANTQKALVVGAIASFLSRRPLIYHLHDILSSEHFSRTNRQLIVTLANRFATLIIANSEATRQAFVAAGGHPDRLHVVYNGFQLEQYQELTPLATQLKLDLGLDQRFVIGHFSRLAPWKGQHVLIEALKHCPKDITVVFVGDALFGEQEYVEQLHQQVRQLGCQHQVQFLGFRSDVPALMAMCDLITHTSIAPEPFGRVIVEAMLCQTPIVAAAAGGAIELVKHGKTGWLVPPGKPLELAAMINHLYQYSELRDAIAKQAKTEASDRFALPIINQMLLQLIAQAMDSENSHFSGIAI